MDVDFPPQPGETECKVRTRNGEAQEEMGKQRMFSHTVFQGRWP